MNKVQTKVRPGLTVTVMNILCEDANGKNSKGTTFETYCENPEEPLKDP